MHGVYVCVFVIWLGTCGLGVFIDIDINIFGIRIKFIVTRYGVAEIRLSI